MPLASIVRILRWAAMLSLIVMMLVTVVDISLRLGMNELVLGSVEIVQFMVVAVVFLALPETFARDQHITVDAIDQFVSPRKQRILRFIAALLSLALLVAMALRMLPIAADTLIIGDLTTDLQISLFWYWLPVLIGAVFSVLAMFRIVVAAFRHIGNPRAESSGAD